MLVTTQQQKTVKDILPVILSTKHCSVKEIQHDLFSTYRKKVSAQAIYKTLNNLLAKQVLVKKEKKYGLHKEWINYLETISKKAKLHEKKKEFINPKQVKIETLIFQNLLELDAYCSDLHNHHYSNEKEICSVYRHHWWHLIYPMNEYDNANGNKKYYLICTKNTLLDLQGINFKKNAGMNVVYKKIPIHGELEVHEEFVIEKFIPQEINSLLDNFFDKTKSVVDLDVKELTGILKKDCEIIVVINKNIALANELRNHIKKEFCGKAK